jgi:intracellular septation protein
MKFLFDLLPVGSFLVALLIWDIFVATAVAIAVTVGQISWLAINRKKIHGTLWISAACVLVFGSLTLILQDKTFIQWKPTVVYWLFGAVLAIAPLLGKNLIKTMMSEQLQLPEKTWSRVNWSWVAFFGFMGAANLYVAYNFSEKVWGFFKAFGGIGLMIVFAVVQSFFLAKHMDEKQ